MKLKKIIQFYLLGILTLGVSPVFAQQNFAGLPPMYVDGNYLKDAQGNKLVLHGVMDTPSPYFNEYRWGGSANDDNVNNCVNYFTKIFDVIADPENGTHCNLFRLHLDPAWTNGKAGSTLQDAREKGTGEADITKYEGDRLTKYLSSVYIPIAQKAMNHKMYVIMRPPGVCPHDIYVGGSYQKYLLDVWDRVSKHRLIQKYCGQISLELANEPVNVYMADGSRSDQALRDFFQPIVDKIRENGFTGIIWIPGTGYQSEYRPYVKYPISDNNFGFAVHDYAGWFDTSDTKNEATNSINAFAKQVPVAYTNPIVITEVDWSPEKQPREIKNYNEFGQPTYKNYGSWATASTSKWGKGYKAVLDYFGNISMTLSGTHCYIDYNDCITRSGSGTSYVYTNTGRYTPAYKRDMEAAGLDPYDGCGVACFQWYAEYAKVNYPSLARYQEVQEIPENPFELKKDYFNPKLIYENTATITSAVTTVKFKENGFVGWRFEEEAGIDLTKYKSLTINLVRGVTGNVRFRLYDTSNYWAKPYDITLANKGKDITIDLADLKTTDGRTLDLSRIRMGGFYCTTDNFSLYVKGITLEEDATGIDTPEIAGEQQNGAYYDLSGRMVENPTRGIYIRNGRKVVVK